MKIQLLTRMAGPAGAYNPGDIADLADGLAQKLISSGYAVAIEEEAALAPSPPEPEAAAIDPPEKAVRAPARRRSPRRTSRSTKAK